MRILLIEDDQDVAQVVTAGMQEASHSIVHASNGEDGLALAQKNAFDVMIFDRQLPGGVDGASILATLRSGAIRTPVLFLSGLGGLNDWMKGLDAGGDDYIVKPFVMSELRARVEALYERARAEAEAAP